MLQRFALRALSGLALAMCAVATQPSAIAEAGAAQRLFDVETMLAREEFPAFAPRVAFNPATGAIAFVWLRARAQSPSVRWRAAANFGGGEVFLADADGEARNLTVRYDQTMSWGAPAWSPAGARLAVLSGDEERLWLWASGRGNTRLRRLETPPIEDTPLQPNGYAWLDDDHILAVVRSDGDRSINGAEIQTRTQIERSWRRFDAGVSSAQVRSTLDTEETETGFELTLIDVARNRATTLARHAAIFSIVVSPDAQRIAFCTSAPRPLPAPGRAQVSSGRACDLKIIDRSGRLVQAIDAPADGSIASVRWSPDSSTLAYVAIAGEHRSIATTILETLDHHAPFQFDGLDLSNARFLWSAHDALLVRARGPGGRIDWWSVGPTHAPKNLTEALTSPPLELVPAADGAVFVGLSGGSLWRIDPGVGTATLLPSPPIDTLVLPASARRDQGYTHIGFSGRETGAQVFGAVDLHSGQVDTVRPRDDETYVSFTTHHGRVQFLTVENGRSGTRLSMYAAQAPERTLHRANRSLAQLETGVFTHIAYQVDAGQDRTGWLLLPPSSARRERPPALVVSIYPGAGVSREPPAEHQIHADFNFLNAQLLASHGYAVLLPELPALSPTEANPFQSAAVELDAAISAIALAGYADPERVFLVGHSYGGYAVNGILGASRRYRAAVSISGVADPASKYRSADAAEASNNPEEFAYYEAGQGGLGAAPWDAPDLYARATPVTYAQTIVTPLLLVHGALDGTIPPDQSVQMYQTLLRLNRPAELVIYGGEGHTIESPANVRDMWRRILSWLNRFDVAASAAATPFSTTPANAP